ncbi:MAG: twin-arginine translocase TatA/TatE family subunit [Halothece sp.]|jgi:sec-independent protein translocase protein TatA
MIPRESVCKKDLIHRGNMFGIGWLEVTVILGVAILIFGPKKLPEMGNSVGKALRGFRDEMNSPPEEEDSDFEKR